MVTITIAVGAARRLRLPAQAPRLNAAHQARVPRRATQRLCSVGCPRRRRGLLTRAQEQLSSELSRLQLAIGELLDANLSPAAAGAASEAGGASETGEAGEAGEAAGGLEARVCSLARRLGWARSDLALLRPHVEAH